MTAALARVLPEFEAFEALDTAAAVTVIGVEGLLVVEPSTGEVLRVLDFHGSGALANVVRVDLDEWRAAWRSDPLGQQIDVQDVGYWTTVGVFTPPDAEWRGEIRSHRETRIARLGSVFSNGRA